MNISVWVIELPILDVYFEFFRSPNAFPIKMGGLDGGLNVLPTLHRESASI